MTILQKLLDTYRKASLSEREKGTYFEELIVCYLRNEATYRDLYDRVWTYSEWAHEQGLDKRDTGIDLVARTAGTGEIHAIQCKLYAEDYKLQKSDIDSFFTASGKKPFARRIIVGTTRQWSEHADDALRDQQPPVNKIDLADLENSQIDWSLYQPHANVVLKPKKSLRQHQSNALSAAIVGFSSQDRGKLIMACGTGKTFTSLKIAETQAGRGSRVLFLVPSLSLLSQTLTEWTQESSIPLHSFAVCSDSDVGKKRKKDDDIVQTFTHELRYPATTEPSRLATEMAKRHDDEHMSVVFSTYHSIDVIARAQAEHSLATFDLVVCDEAHRTTGATFGDEDESNFVKVHDADYIHALKRLYMTATPRIYGDNAKASAERDNVALCSMDDETLYGKELFVITFSEAVKRGLLVDYKVIVLAVEEAHVNRRLQTLLSDENNQLKVDDAAKIIGCWKALSKQGLDNDLAGDSESMRRAVAFCQVIEVSKGVKAHKVSSKNIAGMFQAVVEAYQESEEPNLDAAVSVSLACEAAHVDGSMNAGEKEAKLTWLKEEPPENTCRILSNVRCLSEGVDVPALDAVLFLTPRNSQVDVVQSVGRVMRNAPGKKLGYVILPVVIPAGMEPHEALNDNKTYSVVWQVLQALRSHDDRFDAMVNKLDLIGQDTSKMEVIAITDKVQKKVAKPVVDKTGKTRAKNKKAARNGFSIGTGNGPTPVAEQVELEFEIGEIEKAIYAKLVSKVGNRHHWEDWANDIAKIARTHIDRITALLEDPANTVERDAFDKFARELRDDLNDSITQEEVVEMLAQHLITKPVFDALFKDYAFAQQNPMSRSMQEILNVLQEHRLDKEADTLQSFYDSVKLRADGIESAEGKQKIIIELYDKFFANAFTRLRDKLGIVYTPVPVVDFIIHSVAKLLKNEFGLTLGSKGVHIIDPFTGTGTFVSRLLQSGLISDQDLPHKYKNEIHANELVLLAYYIAAINIEAVYHNIVGGEYVPFEGICLADTFQMYEKVDLVDALKVDNSARRKRQRKLDIRVIFGNPPYSAGQESANDNNANVSYPNLDDRIRSTYAARSVATSTKNLMDSYVRAFRWASDRLGDSGIIGFVTNASFVEASSFDGMRQCLAEEFSSIYLFHLRGNQATTIGEISRKEGGKIFAGGSRQPIVVALLVKNPKAEKMGRIYFHDIGSYLSRDEKLEIVGNFGSVQGIEDANGWTEITPDEHGDWLRQRDKGFGDYLVLGDKKGTGPKLFESFSQGVLTARDAWCYNASRQKVAANMKNMIAVYNQEATQFKNRFGDLPREKRQQQILMADAVMRTPSLISWSSSLFDEVVRGKLGTYRPGALVPCLYRPFFKQWLYFDGMFNHRLSKMPRIFPNADAQNRVIVITGTGTPIEFTCFMTDVLPDYQGPAKSQCFPLYIYDGVEEIASESNDGAEVSDDRPDGNKPQAALFEEDKDIFESSALKVTNTSYQRRDGITDEGLATFQGAYPNVAITKEDIFYYVYGLLHSTDYRERYADNLAKELPRIPPMRNVDGFWAFSRAGRQLANLHVNYETIHQYPCTVNGGGDVNDYRVEKMRLGKVGKEKDLTTVHYNSRITISGIPEDAWNYMVNGKPALDWVMERQSVKLEKDSGIVNDANEWANETMKNPKYPLELFLRMVTVSIETLKIMRGLPALDVPAN